MSDQADLLRAIADRPEEAGQTWLVLADLLEENGDPRHELIRLAHEPDYAGGLPADERHGRVVSLLRSGLRPCVPAWTNEFGMRFVWCPPGAFLMGTPEDDGLERAHPVTLSAGFWLADAPVTQSQWRAVLGTPSPSQFRGDDRPADSVSWHDCQALCAALSVNDGRPYRLPTEAEWEYACRAGTTTDFFWGTTISTDLANYDGNGVFADGREGVYRRETVPVRSFPPNLRGLFEMHGNVREWCEDRFGPYPEVPVTDPTGAESGTDRVLRGGSWYCYPSSLRSAYRGTGDPADRLAYRGFRPCVSAGAAW